MLTLDCHVHLYPSFSLPVVLDAALANMRATWETTDGSVQPVRGVLLLTRTAHEADFKDLCATIPHCLTKPWRIDARPDDLSLILRHGPDTLTLVAGRQMATREGLEVHALGTRQDFPERLPARRLLEAVNASGALVAIPWGAGKWLGARGNLLRALVDDPSLPFLLSDSGLRPGGWPRPKLFAQARRNGRTWLAGSDPLPLPGAERRVGRFGLTLDPVWADTAAVTELIGALRDPTVPRRRVGYSQALLP